MQIGQVIRKYRKQKNLTQDEMAARLGVTAPAVNKWEKENSYPDITLLVPIARLLDITPDILLSFREELTAEEINEIVYCVDRMWKEKSYEEVFQWVKKKLEEYPNCEMLIWQLAVLLDSRRLQEELPEEQKYEEFIHACYLRVLESSDETVRTGAAGSLFSYYMQKQEYEKAEGYLSYFSKENPERKWKQAYLYEKTDRLQDAYRVNEELLFSCYQTGSVALQGMYSLAARENDRKKMHVLADKQGELAKCFEMGSYYEASGRLMLAIMERDEEMTLAVAQRMLSGLAELAGFRQSSLYEHMSFREMRGEFLEDMRENLLNALRNDEACDFMKDNAQWQELIK